MLGTIRLMPLRLIPHSNHRDRDMLKIARTFAADQNGATAIEYGLMAALISVVIIVALQTAGTNLIADFTSVATALR